MADAQRFGKLRSIQSVAVSQLEDGSVAVGQPAGGLRD
jgi:hypothetical protein